MVVPEKQLAIISHFTRNLNKTKLFIYDNTLNFELWSLEKKKLITDGKIKAMFFLNNQLSPYGNTSFRFGLKNTEGFLIDVHQTQVWPSGMKSDETLNQRCQLSFSFAKNLRDKTRKFRAFFVQSSDQ